VVAFTSGNTWSVVDVDRFAVCRPDCYDAEMEHLTAEQRTALGQGEAVPLMVDATECVLLRKDVYDRIQELIEDWDPRVMRGHLAQMMADDWNDPRMSIHDQ
jgi:hypothetical protein